jgi:N-acetylneuraminic acid mutarotase
MRFSCVIAGVVLVALLGCSEGAGTDETSTLIAAEETTTQAEPSSSPVQAGEWQQLRPLPAARSEVAAVALEGKVYVIGGLTPDGGVSSKVEVYDPAEDSWDEVAELPVPLHHAAAAVVEGKLYVIGGFVRGFAPTDSVFEYDPATDSWQAKKPMPTARGALAATALNGKIYAIGGVKGFGLENVAALEAYDQASDTWESRSPMPRARDHLAAGVVDGKIYAIGGRLRHNFGSNLNFNEEYDPTSDSREAFKRVVFFHT